MNRLINALGTIALLVAFATVMTYAALLLPIVLGCCIVVWILFLLITSGIDAAHALWQRIRSPPGRRRQR